jgi:hypothetical protein
VATHPVSSTEVKSVCNCTFFFPIFLILWYLSTRTTLPMFLLLPTWHIKNNTHICLKNMQMKLYKTVETELFFRVD